MLRLGWIGYTPRLLAAPVAAAVFAALTGCQAIDAHMAASDGFSAYKERRFDDAIAAYERAVAGKPESFVLQKNLAYSHLSAARSATKNAIVHKHLNAAIDVLRGYVEATPDDRVALERLVAAWMEADRGHEAVAFFQAQVAASPDDVSLLKMLGQLHARRGSFAEALAVYERWRTKEAQLPDAHMAVAILAWEWLHAGGPADAKEAIALATTGLNAAWEAERLQQGHQAALVYGGLLLRARATRRTDPQLAQQDIEQAQIALAKRNAALAAAAKAAAEAEKGALVASPDVDGSGAGAGRNGASGVSNGDLSDGVEN